MGSNRDVVRAHLAANPGHHRPSEVALATGLTTHQAAVALYGLFEHGEAERGKRDAKRTGGRPHNTYAITEAGIAVASGEAVGAGDQAGTG